MELVSDSTSIYLQPSDVPYASLPHFIQAIYQIMNESERSCVLFNEHAKASERNTICVTYST